MKQSRPLDTVTLAFVQMIFDEKRFGEQKVAEKLESRLKPLRETFGIPAGAAITFADGPTGGVVAEWDAPDIAPPPGCSKPSGQHSPRSGTSAARAHRGQSPRHRPRRQSRARPANDGHASRNETRTTGRAASKYSSQAGGRIGGDSGTSQATEG